MMRSRISGMLFRLAIRCAPKPVVRDPERAAAVEVARLLGAQMMATDTLDLGGLSLTVSGADLARVMLPFMAPEIEHDQAIANAMANAMWPTLLQKMVLYFRANPPAAAPSPKNFFGF